MSANVAAKTGLWDSLCKAKLIFNCVDDTAWNIRTKWLLGSCCHKRNEGLNHCLLTEDSTIADYTELVPRISIIDLIRQLNIKIWSTIISLPLYQLDILIHCITPGSIFSTTSEVGLLLETVLLIETGFYYFIHRTT